MAEEPDKTAGYKDRLWSRLQPFFEPPAEYAEQFGEYRSPLIDREGIRITRPEEWDTHREALRREWHQKLGEWPEVNKDPEVEVVSTEALSHGVTLKTIRFEWAPGEETRAHLLRPQGKPPFPAVITLYYEPETAIGRGKPDRDFAWQLAKRGFVSLSLGTSDATAARTYAIYYPSLDDARVEPLSMLACAATSAWYVLAAMPEVDSERIGIVGHSFGGKWALFASCLFDGFACAVWSDPGIVFDESRPSVNYWEPWYLGYHPRPWRKRGVITPENPARGCYPRLVDAGWDLHLLHALMAPRPFLVSGGSEDPPSRWLALNHTVAVNRLLGYENRVAMSNRPQHVPNSQSNAVIFDFFEYFLSTD